MKNRKITLEEIDKLKPCKPAKEFLGADWSGTLLDILNHPDVSDLDKIWAVTKLIDEKTARLFAVYCARSCVKYANPDHHKFLESILDVAETFAHGLASAEELEKAERAAASLAATAADAAYAAAFATTDAAHAASTASAYAAAANASTDAATAAFAATAAYAAYADALAAATYATDAAYAADAAYASYGHATVADVTSIFVQQLKAMIEPSKVRFVKTNIKLGNKPLYIKAGG